MSVRHWATEFDHFDPDYAADPFAVWDELRTACPVARSDRFRDMLVPTRHADIEAVARDTATWSSRSPLVADFGSMADFGILAPPISSDPPYHTSFRKLLLPFFSPQRMEALRPAIEEHCDALIDALGEAGVCDAAVDYAQHIPVHVITLLLGIPREDGELFRSWIHDLLEVGPTDIEQAAIGLFGFGDYLSQQIQRRLDEGMGDDLIRRLPAPAGGWHRHDVECDRRLVVAPGREPCGPAAPSSGAGSVAHRHRGTAPGLRAGHHGS